MTELEKRLIALSDLGIVIHHHSGHRWLECVEIEDDSFHKDLQKHGIYVNNKIYSRVEEALDVIESRKIGKPVSCPACKTYRWLDETRKAIRELLEWEKALTTWMDAADLKELEAAYTELERLGRPVLEQSASEYGIMPDEYLPETASAAEYKADLLPESFKIAWDVVEEAEKL